jgi:hypothetical protein
MAEREGAGAPSIPNAVQVLMAIARSYRNSQLLYVAAKLQIADLLADGPRTSDQIAEMVGASPDALLRIMRGLYFLGLFDWGDNDQFALNELSRHLVSTAPSSVRPGVICLGQEQYRAWADLLDTVMTGEPAFQRLFGNPFDYYDEHPETGEAFDSWMATSSRQVSAGILQSYDFPAAGTVVDVGGGEGILLAGILETRPRLRGILMERNSVIEKARSRLTAQGVVDRCKLVGGDFRKAVPSGGDLYILRNILHDWDDSAAVLILKATRRAMKRSAHLLVIQRVMPTGKSNAPATRGIVESDLNQMAYAGGRERTELEYQGLFTAAGLEVTLTMQANGVTWLMDTRAVRR